MFSRRDKTQMSRPGRRAPGPRHARVQRPARHFVLDTPLEPPFPEGFQQAMFGLGLLLGRGAQVLGDRRRVHDRGRLRGRLHAEPDVRRGVQRPHRSHRGRARRVRSRSKSATTTLLRVFWENHDPTQGMRQGNDVGTQYRSGIYTFDDEQRAAAEASREHVPGAARRRRATATSRPRSSTRRPSTTPRTTTSSTWPRTRWATAASAAPASAARSGSSDE